MKESLLTADEMHLFHEGTLYKSYQSFGAHLTQRNNVRGVIFTVWAPNAESVSVVGDFNQWHIESHPMNRMNTTGIWSVFIAGLGEGTIYKYALKTACGDTSLKADPFAFFSERRPKSASVVFSLEGYSWEHAIWEKERQRSIYQKPMLIYEVHLGSWKRKENGDFYTYRELADELIDYVKEMGYTHIELMPIMEHPFDGSWGYQVTGFFSVTSRYGNPHDFMYFVNRCHQVGIGVILDWVPAHFCKDGHGLGVFDGTPLYEKEEDHQWGTYVFDYQRPEVMSFLISNAAFWFDIFHIDGLRVDAVAHMLYLDYGKKTDEWQPNIYGGRENLEAIKFMHKLNEYIFQEYPYALMIAEESSEWPLVSRPVHLGGLGYNYKWNMGWMNDILRYMEMDPIHRKWHHHLLNFSLMYAFSENFILPLSHDEVVHGKKSLLDKMPGDYWKKFANLRVLLGFMMAHPGKKLLFMGTELAPFIEWRYDEELEWFLLDFEMHQKFNYFVKTLNHFYLQEKLFWERDHGWEGFEWIDANNYTQSIVVFLRYAVKKSDFMIVICNFTPVVYENYRIGVPEVGLYQEIFNTDENVFGGSGQKNPQNMKAETVHWHNQPYSLCLKIPPLSVIFLKHKVKESACKLNEKKHKKE